jgi:hypothetical protein
MLKGDGKMRTDKLQELKKIAAQMFGDRSQASTAATPAAEGERENETATSDRPHSPLAGLGVERAIHLRWVLRDIKGKRTKMSPVSPDDLRTLIEMNLVEMRDDVPVLTNEGDRALDWI